MYTARNPGVVRGGVRTEGGGRTRRARSTRLQFGLYKRFFYIEWFVHASIVLSFSRPACIAPTVAIRLHDYWAIYGPRDIPRVCHTPYNIGNNNLV